MLEPSLFPRESLGVRLRSDPPGVTEIAARTHPAILLHVGPSVHVGCDRGGRKYRGVTVHGDVDIVPPGTPCRWELKQKDTVLLLGPSVELINTVAEEAGMDSKRVDVVNRFQTRDPQIEHVGWALKAEMESGYRGGRLCFDSLAMGLAVSLIDRHSSVPACGERPKMSMSGRRMREAIGYIEDHLGGDLSLKEIADAVGISVSHFKAAFREAAGIPVHQYVIQRRVERAKTLLANKEMSVGRVALETGFAHQSHLAHHMRRLLGVTPNSLRS